MSQSVAIRRLKKEYQELHKNPVHAGIFVQPNEANFLHAHFLLSGESFHDTAYEGGVYHGVLKFPPNYPLKPPSVLMYTPSGRFKVNQRICFSYSDFHPELWCPAWNIRTILVGLVSFMNSEEATTGEVIASHAERVRFAQESVSYCVEKDAEASTLFAAALDDLVQRRAELGQLWPPPRSSSASSSSSSS
jgi:ubiquitin-conjugating enzyme E2 J2